MNLFKRILPFLILLLASTSAMSQYVIDKVCVGSERHYKVDGELGLMYEWTLRDASGTITVLPETADTVTILWDVAPGKYTLATQAQDDITGCLSLVELGDIIVYPVAELYAGPDQFFCRIDQPYQIVLSDSLWVTNIMWTTTGDGTFDDPASLHPTYTFTTNDLIAGSVIITITGQGLGNSGSCPPAESSAVITLGTMLVDTIVTPASCSVVADGAVQITAFGGNEPYTYIFNGETVIGTSATYTDLAAGTYEYFINDASICETHGYVTIPTLPELSAGAIPTDETYAGMSDGTITVINSAGGSGSYEYMLEVGGVVFMNWQSSNQFVGLPAGSYDVYMRDMNAPDCRILIKTVIIGVSDGLTADVDHTDQSCYGVNNGSITFSNPQNGSGDYEFSIDGSNWSTETVYKDLAPGNYVVMMRDLNFPANVASLGVITIEVAIEITASVDKTDETVAGASNGTITVINPQGGTGPYMYSLDGTVWQTSPIFMNLAPGMYSVWVKDMNECVKFIQNVEILPAGALAADVDFTPVKCFGDNDGTITITNPIGGSGVYEYQLDGLTLWNAAMFYQNLSAGTYVVMMRDANNILNEVVLETIIITEPDVLYADVSFTSDTCDKDGSITISNPVGGYGSYQYSINGVVWQDEPLFVNLNAGFYQVFLRDSLYTTCSLKIEEFWIPYTCTLSADVDSTAITCYDAADGSITITNPQGGTSGDYEFSIDGGSSWQTSGIFGPLAPDTYIIMMREAGLPSTEVTLQTIVLDNPVRLAASVSSENESYLGAADGIITISLPTGGSNSYEYMLESGGVTVRPWQPSNIFTGLAPGLYDVYMRDANNIDCIVPLGTIEILPGGVLTAQYDSLNVSCYGANNGEITFTNPQGGSGQYQFSIDGGSTWQDSPSFTSLAPGSYILMIRDADNPTHTNPIGTVEITEPDELMAIVEAVMIGCDGGNTGSITFTNISGGSEAYEFSIDGGSTWQSLPLFTDLSAFIYHPMMRDSANITCNITFPEEEITTGIPIVVTVRTEPESCDMINGAIYVTATGGTGTFEYVLQGDTAWQSYDVIDSLAAGFYYVVVRDDGGCETTYGPIEVEGLPGVDITDVIVTHTTNGEATGTAEIIANSQFMPIRYSLDSINWQASKNFKDLPAGPYTAWAMDANGCIDKYEFDIGNIVLGIIELVSGRVTDCVGEIRLLDVLVYEFDSISSFKLRLTYNPQIFEFMGFQNIHNNLVQNNVAYTIVSPGILDITYTDPAEVSVGDGELLLQMKIRGIAPGETELQWKWLECVVMSPIGYVTPVTAVVNGLAEVFANPDLKAWQSDEFCSGDSTTLFASTTMDQVVFTWTHPRGIKHMGDTWDLGSLGVLDAGDYIVEAKKEDQCFTLDTVNIEVFPSPNVNINYADTLCFGNPIVLDPGEQFNTYEWNTGSSMPSIIAYEAGIYWLKVIDFNGCRGIDSVMLEPCIIEILIPNAFTPNGDGLNDDFEPIFRGFEPANYRMDIYSKWGQLVFTTNSLGHGWDGTINGELVSPDTFVYIVSYEVPSFVLRKGLSSPVTGRVSVIR